MPDTRTDKIEKTDAEWRAQLTPEQYHITRQKGTEPAFTGKLTYNHDTGMYRCVACGADLFASDTKFDSGSGWPSFYLPVNSAAIETHEDNTLGMRRMEVELRPLRRSPRPRLPRRPAAHRPALLHQLRSPELRQSQIARPDLRHA